MKSVYFTSKQIDRQAEDFLNSLDLSRSREITWERPALLVLDMQDYFLSPDSHAFVPSAPAILPGVKRLIGAFRPAGLPVIYTQHLNTEADVGMMSKWWRDVLTREHRHANLAAELEDQADIIIEKSQYDAFFGTDLHQQLRAESVTDLVITGVMTHLCCETTARSGFMHGYRTWFTIDGTATYTPEFHLASLHNLSHGFATPVLVSEALEALV